MKMSPLAPTNALLVFYFNFNLLENYLKSEKSNENFFIFDVNETLQDFDLNCRKIFPP